MSEKKAATKKENKETPKNALLNTTILQLSESLTSLKDTLGERKFNKRIRKAAKMIIEGVKASSNYTEETNSQVAVPVVQQPKAKKAAPKKVPVKTKAPRKKRASAIEASAQ